ncbi:hypothetical protein Pd630_LPD00298 [Rhodococcus opacus PD630]|nr:hypothetical protein Pd630_LPD00298 [Rhodococcus opacus PD630]
MLILVSRLTTDLGQPSGTNEKVALWCIERGLPILLRKLGDHCG